MHLMYAVELGSNATQKTVDNTVIVKYFYFKFFGYRSFRCRS